MNKKQILELCKIKKLTLLNEIPEKVNCRKDKFEFVDNKGYKYYLTIDSLKDKRTGHAIVKKNNPFSLYNIQHYINLHGGKSKVLSQEWNGEKAKIKLLCSCGKEYEAIWYHIYAYKKFQCNQCGYSLHGNKKEKSFFDTNKICKKHGYNIIKGTFRNKKHFDLIDKNGYKYFDCSVFTLDKNNMIRNRFSDNNIYLNENIKLFIQINGSCPQIIFSKCQSGLEETILEYLKELNICYEQQKKFDWCRRKNYLPFDFYLQQYNVCIEVHGKQHYEPVDMFGGELKFELQKQIDGYKKECCKKNNVAYIEISYLDIQNKKYKQIINNIIG